MCFAQEGSTPGRVNLKLKEKLSQLAICCYALPFLSLVDLQQKFSVSFHTWDWLVSGHILQTSESKCTPDYIHCPWQSTNKALGVPFLYRALTSNMLAKNLEPPLPWNQDVHNLQHTQQQSFCFFPRKNCFQPGWCKMQVKPLQVTARAKGS